MSRSVIAAAIGAVAWTSPGQAAPPIAASPTTHDLSWMVGSWQGTGTSMGQPARATLDLRPVLGGRFLELVYRLSTTGPRPFTFEGRAFYKSQGDGRWEARWFDSRGISFPIKAAASATVLTSDWGDDSTERGTTVYRREGDSLTVVDSIAAKTGVREFARLTYTKADESAPK